MSQSKMSAEQREAMMAATARMAAQTDARKRQTEPPENQGHSLITFAVVALILVLNLVVMFYTN